MQILVWGLGYVGTVSAVCFARLGHKVIGVEPNQKKVDSINSGGSAVREPGVSELVAQAVATGALRATSDPANDIPESDVSLICVGTPSQPDGSADLGFIRSVAQELGAGIATSDRFHTVILRSTVLPGVTRSVLVPLLEEASGKKAGDGFGVVMNPEFLREATAIKDFDAPPYTIIGELDSRSGDVAEALYGGVDAPIHRVPLETAEMLKLGNNAFHALKIGFANEMGRIADSLEVDGKQVMELICADRKLNISSAYMRPGFAFGGSCLPKDLRSLNHYARSAALDVPILGGILPSNSVQIDAARRRIAERNTKAVGVLGLSFKPNTDDLRESPTLALVRSLWQDGFDVLVGDPDIDLEQMLGANLEYLERQLPQIHQIFCADLEQVVKRAELIVVTHRRAEYDDVLSRSGVDPDRVIHLA